MILQAGMLGDILSALKSDRRNGDHRRNARVGLRAKVHVAIYTEGKQGPTQMVWLRNISSGGVGLLFPMRLQAESSFLIRLPTRDNEIVTILCSVIHCHSLGTGQFGIGAKFIAEPCKE